MASVTSLVALEVFSCNALAEEGPDPRAENVEVTGSGTDATHYTISSFAFRVKNYGDVTASGTVTVEFYDKGPSDENDQVGPAVLRSTQSVGSISVAPGATSSVLTAVSAGLVITVSQNPLGSSAAVASYKIKITYASGTVEEIDSGDLPDNGSNGTP